MRWFAAFSLIAVSSVCVADVQLNSMFQSNMVIPDKAQLPIWGTGTPGESVLVLGSWGAVAGATVDESGRWRTTVITPSAQTGLGIEVIASNRIQLSNVASGDVWVCIGQSNMEHTLAPTPGLRSVLNADQEIADANYPNLRLLRIARVRQAEPAAGVNGTWETCTSQSVPNFSALGYFFGRDLHLELAKPIGVIAAVKGGTTIEEWMPNSAFAESGSTVLPTTTYYNGMLAPMRDFPVDGLIIWTGEGNVSRPNEFGRTWRTWLTTMRQAWNLPALPTYFVQLPPYNYSGARKGGAPLSREGQADSLALARTGMVVISDLIDDLNDIHPIYKQAVADRIVRSALGVTYKRSGKVGASPQYLKHNREGRTLRVMFKSDNGGLISPDTTLTSFEVSDGEGVWHPATAIIERGAVTVWNDAVLKPVHVRYGWADAYVGNLFNGAGNPASPFRSDKPLPPFDR